MTREHAYVSFPDRWPAEWGYPGEGPLRLMRTFFTMEEAEKWVEQGCPGILKPFRPYRAGWNRMVASPMYFWLDEASARALAWQDQKVKFDWCRQNAVIGTEPPELGPHPDQVFHEEKELLFPGDDLLARAHFLKAHTLTNYPQAGLD